MGVIGGGDVCDLLCLWSVFSVRFLLSFLFANQFRDVEYPRIIHAETAGAGIGY